MARAATKYAYRVEINKKVVWSETFRDATTHHFPPEYLSRPDDGAPAHHLFIDDECVGVQVSLADEEAQS